ncbi:MAG TPA: alkaline phosphatase family protein [Blastocatellia bacterium]|nr:alkaline phosphatase family protein [Blastocatellia bacterium]
MDREPKQTPRRKLILALDGVPWQAIDESRRSGRFQVFHAPGRVISPFPTMTNIGMGALLGTRKTLGYENLYFDRARGRMCGGAMKYVQLRKRDPERRGYNHLLDYEEPMQFEFLVYVAPERIFSSDLSRLIDRFARSDAPVFYGFLKSTDGLIHVGGREALLPALERLDAALGELYETAEGRFEIVVYSDHGNALVPFKRVPLKTHLARHGFEPSGRIKSRRSVIIPGFGLVSYAPIYASPERRQEIAEALASLAGVDFSAFRNEDDGVTELISPRGHARLHHDSQANAFRYEQVFGDPLGLGPIVELLQSEGSIDSRGYGSDAAWFDATKDHRYPDALSNIWRSVREHVESTADVLVSFEDGYCYGNAIFDRIITLRATHGSALQSTSYAFLMSTNREVPAHLRADQARPLIRPHLSQRLQSPVEVRMPNAVG